MIRRCLLDFGPQADPVLLRTTRTASGERTVDGTPVRELELRPAGVAASNGVMAMPVN